MLGVLTLTLALVLGQVVTHPPDVTMNDDDLHNDVTLNDGDERLLSVVEPFEISNPSRVAAGELYQSDMLLIEEQWAALRSRKALADERYRWTEGSDGYPLVPYVFLDSVDQDDVRAALDHWMEHTCIKFEETSNEDQPHLQFHIGSGCWSYVGMIWHKKGQKISIGSGCNSLGVVAHEVGHAMGFKHEQSRSDRDDYVRILTENIRDGKEGNFDKTNDNNFSVTYDYSSNMHYGMDYFTKNGKPTIVTIDPMAQELIGSRKGLTHRDKLLGNRMYNCIGKWLTKCGISSDPCLNDGYTGKDCTCICPPGTSGSNCENIVDDYYAQLRNPLSEKIITEKTITIETPMDAGTKFVKWIVPPTCKKAKVTFTSSNMYSKCQYQYLNVKTDSSDVVGEKMCAADVSAGVTLTSDTGIIITMINKVNYGFQKTLWEADVTFEDKPGCTRPKPTPQPTPKPTEPPGGEVVPCQRKSINKALTKGTSIIIASPNFPENYKGPIKCGYKLKGPRKSTLNITCDSFDLKGKDRLRIGKTSFRGTTAPSLTLKRLTIKFMTKKKSSGPGFRCTVKVIGGK